MTEQQLLYFTAIVSTGSYSEAALELDISQSAVSKQILSLEDELGVKLFDRSKRKASLTSAGERLYPEAMAILEKMKQLKKNAEKLQPDYKEHITILTIPIIGQFHFYTPVYHFENQNPDYIAELVELEEPSLFRRILKNDYNLAIAYYDESYLTRQTHFVPLIEDEIVLAVHKNHPLADYDRISPDELHMLPVMGMDSYTCISHIYQQYFERKHIHLNIIFRGRPESILGGVEAGKCPALVTRLQANYFKTNDVKLISLAPALPAQLGIIVKKTEKNYPAYKELIRLFKKLSIYT